MVDPAGPLLDLSGTNLRAAVLRELEVSGLELRLEDTDTCMKGAVAAGEVHVFDPAGPLLDLSGTNLRAAVLRELEVSGCLLYTSPSPRD